MPSHRVLRGGTSFSPFHTMLAAYYAGREGQTKAGLSLAPQHLWWQHTELLFAMIVLGDDRLVEKTVISQNI